MLYLSIIVYKLRSVGFLSVHVPLVLEYKAGLEYRPGFAVYVAYSNNSNTSIALSVARGVVLVIA